MVEEEYIKYITDLGLHIFSSSHKKLKSFTFLMEQSHLPELICISAFYTIETHALSLQILDPL